MNLTAGRLDQIRGAAPPRPHNARTVAALTRNPGCARRAILDAAGIDKPRLAQYAGFPAPFGQSQFAITRGNAFEQQVKASGCAELLRLLRERLSLPIPEASYDDLTEVGGTTSMRLRHSQTRSLLTRSAASADSAGTMFDHPLLKISVGGQPVYLEPDLIAFRLRDQFRIVEIKSFAIIDGQADAEKVAAAAMQSAVYVLAMRDLLASGDTDRSGLVSDEVILVCPENFSNRPTAAFLDVRKQLTVLNRQLARLTRIEEIVGGLPPGFCLDLQPDADGVPTRPAAELAVELGRVPARYVPDCLASCEMCYFCRAECRGTTAALGQVVRDDLGGIEYVDTVLRLARGEAEPGEAEAEAAAMLRSAARLRAECLGQAS